jgi:lipopolysaccharide export LptBFGC system permease protein LptF
MAGLSKKTLLRPFFSLAAVLSLTLYANSQWFAPDAQDAAHTFRSEHSSSKKKKKREYVYNLALDDDSELIYQSFNEKQNTLFDAYWIKTPDDIWHMKYLECGEHPQGYFVDHLQRNRQGQFEKTESFPTRPFPRLSWDKDATLERFVPFENRSISTLLSQALIFTADRPSIFAHLHYKLALPLLPFFIIIGISPVVMQFNRSRPTFLIVAISLCLCFALMTILDGMLILGENQVIPGYLAIWGPIALLFLGISRPFAKL